MEANTINCIIAISVVILLVILARVFAVARTNRERKSNVARMEARQAWTDGYQDRQQEKESGQDQE